MTKSKLVSVLREVFVRLDPHLTSSLCLVGTSSAILQGVPLPAHDIDLLAKNRTAVDNFATAMAGFPVLASPRLLEGCGQYFASFHVDGIHVEVSTVEFVTESDFKEVTGQGPWMHQCSFDLGEAAVPVVALELRLATELIRNRADRYLPLIQHFKQTGETPLLIDVLKTEGLDSRYRELDGQPGQSSFRP